MPRRMAYAAFRAEQEAGRYAPHVKPINEMVDELRDGERGWMPYVAPLHGGVEATVLSVLRDPGPATRVGSGSGFLCIENDDQTAEEQCRTFAEVGLTAADVTPWNAYPWYINAAPTPAQLDAGIEQLGRLLNLMPKLRVVLLQGRDAQKSWARLVKRYPTLAAKVPHVIATFHPSRQALRHPDPDVRRARIEHRAAAYRQLASILDRPRKDGPADIASPAPPRLQQEVISATDRSPAGSSAARKASRSVRDIATGMPNNRVAHFARLLVIAEIHQRGGTAEELAIGNRTELRVRNRAGDDLEIQVLSRRAGDWQASLKDAAEHPNAGRFWVFVDLQGADPWFAVVPAEWMVTNIRSEHAKYLARHGGRRAVTADSAHHRIPTARVEQWRDKWSQLGLGTSA